MCRLLESSPADNEPRIDSHEVREQAKLRVWIDDPHPIFRRGLASCVQNAGFVVAGESSHFKPEPHIDNPGIILFDLGDGGLRNALRHRGEDTRLVALARDVDEAGLCEAIEAGAASLVLHSELTADRLASTLKAVATGRTLMPSSLVGELLERAVRAPRSPDRAGLADREIDVLRLLADGGATKDIADELSYSERTVKNIVHDLLAKMNCRNRAHAVAIATRQGLI